MRAHISSRPFLVGALEKPHHLQRIKRNKDKQLLQCQKNDPQSFYDSRLYLTTDNKEVCWLKIELEECFIQLLWNIRLMFVFFPFCWSNLNRYKFCLWKKLMKKTFKGLLWGKMSTGRVFCSFGKWLVGPFLVTNLGHSFCLNLTTWELWTNIVFSPSSFTTQEMVFNSRWPLVAEKALFGHLLGHQFVKLIPPESCNWQSDTPYNQKKFSKQCKQL